MAVKENDQFFVTLVNVVEVSVVLIGTPKALRLFTSEFRQASVEQAVMEYCLIDCHVMKV